MFRATTAAVFVACLVLSLPSSAAELTGPRGGSPEHADNCVVTCSTLPSEVAECEPAPSPTVDDLQPERDPPVFLAELSRPVRYAIIGGIIGGIIGAVIGVIRKLIGSGR